jgi:hypothetical protein
MSSADEEELRASTWGEIEQAEEDYKAGRDKGKPWREVVGILKSNGNVVDEFLAEKRLERKKES